MEQLTWTGPTGQFLNPFFMVAFVLFAATAIMGFIRGYGTGETRDHVRWYNYILPTIILAVILVALSSFVSAINLPKLFGAGEENSSTAMAWFMAIIAALIPALLLVWLFFKLPFELILKLNALSFMVFIGLFVLYLFLGAILPRDSVGILGNISKRLIPTWVSLIVLFALSIIFKSRLGFYGRLFDNTFGMVGLGFVMFWVFNAIYGGVFGWIITHDVFTQIRTLKDSAPGALVGEDGLYPYYLLGGDHFGRDVFSRMIVGGWIVVQIAPLATLVAFMVGITLGLPAGYYGGRTDTNLSFLANLILAFPVILLFYLLVTPEIASSWIPLAMAALLFAFPIVFLVVLFNSRYYVKPMTRNILVGLSVIILGWIYLSALSRQGTRFGFLPEQVDLFELSPQILIVFVSVVFVNSPTVFRIVRGLALDIKSRDYVGAAQTRGERPWYIMLWEILPNVRGPLIVDFCLRIGYVTILLGTLGFLGLGLDPDSPDWGSTIAAGSKYLVITPYPPLPPALALISLVLGLNLLADGLREESLKD